MSEVNIQKQDKEIMWKETVAPTIQTFPITHPALVRWILNFQYLMVSTNRTEF